MDGLNPNLTSVNVNGGGHRAQSVRPADAAAPLPPLPAFRINYRDALESTLHGFVITNLRGSIEDLNRAATELLGARREFLRNKPLGTFIAPPYRAHYYQQLTRLALQGPAALAWETVIRPFRQAPRPIALSVSIVHPTADTPPALCWLLHDLITRPSTRFPPRRT